MKFFSAHRVWSSICPPSLLIPPTLHSNLRCTLYTQPTDIYSRTQYSVIEMAHCSRPKTLRLLLFWRPLRSTVIPEYTRLTKHGTNSHLMIFFYAIARQYTVTHMLLDPDQPDKAVHMLNCGLSADLLQKPICFCRSVRCYNNLLTSSTSFASGLILFQLPSSPQ